MPMTLNSVLIAQGTVPIQLYIIKKFIVTKVQTLQLPEDNFQADELFLMNPHHHNTILAAQ